MLKTIEIDAILENRFSIEFACIAVYSESTNHSIRYQGTGSISIDDDGGLQLKIHHIFKNLNEKLIANNELLTIKRKTIAGQIIPKESYYDLEGVDMSGRQWTAKRFLIKPNLLDMGIVVTAKLPSVKCEKDRLRESLENLMSVHLFVKGNYNLPWDPLINGNNLRLFFEYVLTTHNQECVIRSYEKKYLELTKNFDSNDAKGYQVLLEALNIATGTTLNPLIVVKESQNKTIAQIFSVSSKKTSGKLPPPFYANNPNSTESFNCFVNAYCTHFSEPWSDMYSFWMRCLSHKQSLLQNNGLILTIIIEGILKEYFKDLVKPQHSKDDITAALKEIKTLKLQESIFNRINGTLNSTPPSFKKILDKLISDNTITAEMKDSWVRLRNSSAHADKLQTEDENPASLQKTVDDLNICLALFYQLIFKHIGYNGEYIDYAAHGQPNTKPRAKNLDK